MISGLNKAKAFFTSVKNLSASLFLILNLVACDKRDSAEPSAPVAQKITEFSDQERMIIDIDGTELNLIYSKFKSSGKKDYELFHYGGSQPYRVVLNEQNELVTTEFDFSNLLDSAVSMQPAEQYKVEVNKLRRLNRLANYYSLSRCRSHSDWQSMVDLTTQERNLLYLNIRFSKTGKSILESRSNLYVNPLVLDLLSKSFVGHQFDLFIVTNPYSDLIVNPYVQAVTNGKDYLKNNFALSWSEFQKDCNKNYLSLTYDQKNDKKYSDKSFQSSSNRTDIYIKNFVLLSVWSAQSETDLEPLSFYDQSEELFKNIMKEDKL